MSKLQCYARSLKKIILYKQSLITQSNLKFRVKQERKNRVFFYVHDIRKVNKKIIQKLEIIPFISRIEFIWFNKSYHK